MASPAPCSRRVRTMAAARPKDAVHGRPVAPQTGRRTKAWMVPAKPPPCIRQAPPLPSRICWLRASATERSWWGGVGAAVNVLAEGEGIVAAPPHQRQERIEAGPLAGRGLRPGCGRFPGKSGPPAGRRGPRTGPAGRAGGPRSRPPAPGPATLQPSKQAATASISLRMAANSAVSSLWLPRVSVTHRPHPRRQQPFGVDLFHPPGSRGPRNRQRSPRPRALASWSSMPLGLPK